MERAFSLVAFQVNRHLLDHMLRLSRALSADFEELLLWGVLSHQNVAHLMPPGAPVDVVLDEEGHLRAGDAFELRPLRIRDLEQITGIPRETVRRKLASLAKKGCAKKTDAGWIFNRAAVDDELRALTIESVKRLLATADMVSRTLESSKRRGC